MEPEKSRLDVLDGLRGFAILLVFLSHMPFYFVAKILPEFFFSWIYGNGVTGVTFLFILSGFLMYYIYPNPPSGMAFLQKRYTRIFPLFLTMAAVMLTARETIGTPIALLALALLIYPAITNIIWTRVVKKLPKIIGTKLFLAFLVLQTSVGLFYMLWIDRHTFAAFSQLPLLFRELLIYLVNATLTLPLGQYVPMLDGVYWTLVAEVLFYCMYPFIVVPLIQFLLPKKRSIKILFLVCLFFLLGGIHMLSYRIFVLSLLQPALFFYFAAGIILAHLFKYHKGLFESFSKTFSGAFYFFPFVFAFATIMSIHDLSFLGQVISPWVRMIFTIPITFCIALILSKKTILAQIFNWKILRFLGTISYSIYLSHSLLIGIAESRYLPTSLFTNIMYIAIVLAADSLVAYYLYTMLEKPYFAKSIHGTIKAAPRHIRRIQPKFLFLGISAVYFIGIFIGYQSQSKLNFFSFSEPIPLRFIRYPKSPSAQSVRLLGNNAIMLTFTARHDNLSLLLIKIGHTVHPNEKQFQSLEFSIRQNGGTALVHDVTYTLDEFNKSFLFPLGFPTMANSNGKTYSAILHLTNLQSRDSVTVDTTTVQAVYESNKGDFIKRPATLIPFIQGKLNNLFQNPEALLSLIFGLPFMAFSLISFFSGKEVLGRYLAREK